MVDETLQCCEENLNLKDDFIACITGNEEIYDSDNGEEIVQALEKVNALHQYFEGQFNSELVL